MGDLNIKAIRDKYLPDLLPSEKRFSVVELDTFKPPSDEDFATKHYETDDDLETITVPEPMGTQWLAYDQDGKAYDLPRRDDSADDAR